MNVLITGGAGFIGSHLADELIARGHRVRVLDALVAQVHGEADRPAPPAYLHPGVEFVAGDVRDRAALTNALRGIDAVAHLAAAVGVGQSQYQPAHYTEVNIGGAALLADVLINERHSVRKTVLTGSMTAYGEGPGWCATHGDVRPAVRTPQVVRDGQWEPRCPVCGEATASTAVREDATLCAENIYALSKRVQEELLAHAARVTGIPHVTLRLFNVFGPRQSLSNPYTGVAAIFVARVRAGLAPIVFEDGRQTRDFVWVGDVAAALADALERETGDILTLNIGSGRAVSILEVAQLVAQRMGVEIEPQITRRFRHGDIRHCTADISRAAQTLGFVPRTSFADGLWPLIAWSRMAESEDRFGETIVELERHRMITSV